MELTYWNLPPCGVYQEYFLLVNSSPGCCSLKQSLNIVHYEQFYWKGHDLFISVVLALQQQFPYNARQLISD